MSSHSDMKTPRPADPCVQVDRLANHESRIDKLEVRVQSGDIEFTKVNANITMLTEKVGILTAVLAWVGGAIGLGLLGTGGTCIVYVLMHWGGKP